MEETQQQQGLRRSLKARHMNMIAIGGAIGTGLFVAGGETVSSAGPGGGLRPHRHHGLFPHDGPRRNGVVPAGQRFF